MVTVILACLCVLCVLNESRGTWEEWMVKFQLNRLNEPYELNKLVYLAPSPRRTTPIVRRRILKSRNNDMFLI